MFLTNFKSAIAILAMACVLSGALFVLPILPLATGQTTAKVKVPQKSPPKETSKWPGEWLFEGNKDDPCAIFQQGRVLLLVNERGDFVTGRITEPNKLVVKGWDGLVGELVDEGKTISWGNGLNGNGLEKE